MFRSRCRFHFLTFLQASAKEIALGEDEPEFSFTGNDISDKLANPDEASKAKKKRKANENAVSSSGLNRFLISVINAALFKTHILI